MWAWLIALALGLGIGTLLAQGGGFAKGVYVGTALTSTALGAVLPILRDTGDLQGRFGTVMMAMGAVGEFGPIIAMSLLLSGRAPAGSAALLVIFALLTAAAVFWALRPSRRGSRGSSPGPCTAVRSSPYGWSSCCWWRCWRCPRCSDSTCCSAPSRPD